MPPPRKTGDPFYWSSAWRELRLRVLKRDGYRCTVCDSPLVGPGQARIDHIKPRSTYPRLAMEIGNLRSLCIDCDAQSHREKGGVAGKRNFKQRNEWFTGCDETGWPIDPNHHWNVERRQARVATKTSG
jgi:5-methylcytosine-specific restriction endonuclease McrA